MRLNLKNMSLLVARVAMMTAGLTYHAVAADGVFQNIWFSRMEVLTLNFVVRIRKLTLRKKNLQ